MQPVQLAESGRYYRRQEWRTRAVALAAIACVCGWAQGEAEPAVRGRLRGSKVLVGRTGERGQSKLLRASHLISLRSWVSCCPWDQVRTAVPAARIALANRDQGDEPGDVQGEEGRERIKECLRMGGVR